MVDAARRTGHCLVVVGAFIGLEASAALAQAGVSGRLVVRSGAPGVKRLGPELARMVGAKLREMGVEITTNAEPEAFEGGGGRAAVRGSCAIANDCASTSSAAHGIWTFADAQGTKRSKSGSA